VSAEQLELELELELARLRAQSTRVKMSREVREHVTAYFAKDLL
jgi:hypothetical protein